MKSKRGDGGLEVVILIYALIWVKLRLAPAYGCPNGPVRRKKRNVECGATGRYAGNSYQPTDVPWGRVGNPGPPGILTAARLRRSNPVGPH